MATTKEKLVQSIAANKQQLKRMQKEYKQLQRKVDALEQKLTPYANALWKLGNRMGTCKRNIVWSQSRVREVEVLEKLRAKLKQAQGVAVLDERTHADKRFDGTYWYSGGWHAQHKGTVSRADSEGHARLLAEGKVPVVDVAALNRVLESTGYVVVKKGA